MADTARSTWLADLPRLKSECAARWSLELGPPFPGARHSWACRARRRDGSCAVLKIQLPDRESELEAAALERWGGAGAVRLLATDPERHALLVEECLPGSPVSAAGPTVAVGAMAGIVRRLAVPAAAPFPPLAEESGRWRSSLPSRWEAAGRPCPRAMVDEVLDLLSWLPTSGGPTVLVHQDLHGDNVLAAAREPWLAIDPKPIAGELAFAAAPVVRSAELGHGRRAVLRRLDAMVDLLATDPDRTRGWALAQTLAWAFEGARTLKRHVEVATWLSRSTGAA